MLSSMYVYQEGGQEVMSEVTCPGCNTHFNVYTTAYHSISESEFKIHGFTIGRYHLDCCPMCKKFEVKYVYESKGTAKDCRRKV
jgi:uncharacterized protein YbaR (Trm112 family)